MSFAILGGILLNIGAYLTYRGKIYQSVIVYLFADVCWIIMAYQNDDIVGFIFITVGTIFAYLAYLKMKHGEMKKTLNKDEDDL
jgi:Ca2+-dependent lipid-binding protein